MVSLDLELDNLTLVTSETSDISHIPPGTSEWGYLKTLYLDNKLENRIIATLFNYILTNDFPCFMMSNNILAKIIKNDINNKNKSINGSQYKYIIKLLISKGYITRLCKHDKAKKRSALYRLLQEDYRNLITKTCDIKEREIEYLNEYVKYQKLQPIKELIIDHVLTKGIPGLN